MALRKNWQRDELLLALNLYCKLPFGQYHSQNPQIIALANFISRTPNAVAMKLSNFASLDPYHQQRGISGLSNIGKADRMIWEEFHNNWTELATESEIAYRAFASPDAAIDSNEALVDKEAFEKISQRIGQNTEKERQIKTRIGQSFFRDVILTSYHETCCVCGLPVPEMLVASHIVPWGVDEQNRLNPHNGLCLCALHDRGFDRGFMTVGESYELIVGAHLDRYLPNEALTLHFTAHHGTPIQLPDKFIPSQDLLSIHRKNIFKG